jgi:predicted methyltransferase
VAEVKSTAESALATFLSQGITVRTAGAPNGFKGLTVRIEGNTIFINVIVVLVEGIDFILTDITVQRASA